MDKEQLLDIENHIQNLFKHNANIPRLMIAGTNSGVGKTTITCGLMQALLNRNMKLSSFKCGPDYIDPLFHEEIIGKKSTNLDLFFMPVELLRETFIKNSNNSDIAIIEGVMGYYDGLGGTTSTASSYDISIALDCPTILIVDAKKANYSLVATISGFDTLYKNSNIVGIILNRCTKAMCDMLTPVIEDVCWINVLGFIPDDEDLAIESRHLGLITAKECINLHDKIDKLAHTIEENIDLDLLIEFSTGAGIISYNEAVINPTRLQNSIFGNLNLNSKPIIAIAFDEAFCFYYNETFDLFKKIGFEIEFFSPLKDETIPKNATALYIGGGYPELYLDQLQDNLSMKNSIKNAINTLKIPTLAECGGFMYLGNTIDEKNMVGIINADFFNTKKSTRFGYINLNANNNNIICKENTILKGHEYHYYDCQNNGETFDITKPIGKRNWQAMHSNDNLLAGFPHLYLPAYFYGNDK